MRARQSVALIATAFLLVGSLAACSSENANPAEDVTKMTLTLSDPAAGGGPTVNVTVKNSTSAGATYSVVVDIEASKDTNGFTDGQVLGTSTVAIGPVAAGATATGSAPAQGAAAVRKDAGENDGTIGEDDVILVVKQATRTPA